MKLIDGLADHPVQKKCWKHDYNVERNGEKVALSQQRACGPSFRAFKRNCEQPHKVKNVIVEPVKIKDEPHPKIGAYCSNLIRIGLFGLDSLGIHRQ